MVFLDDKHFMMIEPKKDCEEPVIDEYTQKATLLKSLLKYSGITKGWHIAACGKVSDNKIWLCPNGMETNSLMLHYICYHRSEVPDSELKKLKNMKL